MNYRLAAIYILMLSFVLSHAVSPIGHDDILRDNEEIIKKSKPEDEENPYFILVGEADKAIAEGDYVNAVLRLKDALRVEPDNPANALVYSNLGMVYSYLDQDSLAMKAYDQALDIAPSMTTVMSNRAMLKLKLGKDKEAFDEFSVVISRDSTNATARFYHGIMNLYSGNLDSAISDFDVLEKIEPNSDNTCIALSTLYSMIGDNEKAIPYFKKLIERIPEPEFYAALAGCYLACSQLSDASTIIAEGLQKFGEDPELYYYRAWLNKESYMLDDAKRDAKHAIELGASYDKVMQLFE